MMQRLSCLFYGFLKIAANAQRLGLGMIRVAILIIFVWIGGLKFRNYEAEGIVPFVANSPFMSFFYNEKAPEYRDYKLKEGEYDAAKHAWHEKNNTYGFSHGLGLLIMGIGILTFLGFFSARIGLAGELLAVIMTLGTLSFLVTTPEVWVPELGSGEYGFPLLSGAGRLVIKDTAILAGVVVLLSDTARKLFCSILTRQSYYFWANGDLRKPYNKPASLSQITSILQLFIKQTSICHDNLLVLQLNIKKEATTMDVAIIKYNAGNIYSVSYALKRLGVEATITADPELLCKADKVIFPGVGEAHTTMEHLKEHNLDTIIKGLKQPVLGICLGMQLMCRHSEEGDANCLGIFDTEVKRFIPQQHMDKVPHMGWNTITNVKGGLFNKQLENKFVYFVHSYYVPVNEYTAATTEYILPFSASLHKDNFYATQFHPEKSGSVGEVILSNFLKL